MRKIENLKFKIQLKMAFTLLEMLVVIGIIAILLGLGAVSYSTAQKKARDSKRKSDLKTIQNALEQYYSICGYVYPLSSGGFVPTSIFCTNPSVTIMSSVPTDPKTGQSYTMSQTSNDNYVICAKLESETPTNYCLNNQQ